MREQRKRVSDVKVIAVRLPCVISKSRSIVKTPALQDCPYGSVEQRKNQENRRNSDCPRRSAEHRSPEKKRPFYTRD